MPLRSLSPERVVLVAAGLLACQLCIALALIPPWQQPDENSHVAHVERLRSRIVSADMPRDPGREAEILQSMDAYDWWEHRDRGFPMPATLPESFIAAGERVAAGSSDALIGPAYFPIAGAVLALLPNLSVVQDMYVLRGISAIVGMLTLWVAWLGTREALGPRGAATVTLLLALHPQFAIVSTAATPDAVANLLGACVWWAAVLSVKATRTWWPLVGVWLGAGAAALTDRMGVPLLALAFAVSIIVLARRTFLRGSWSLGRTLGVGLAATAIFGAALWLLEAAGFAYGLVALFSIGLAPIPDAQSWEYFSRFSLFLHRSWWASLGWGRYAPPSWWVVTTMALTVTAAAGVAQGMVRTRVFDRLTRVLLTIAAIGLAIQLAAVYWAYFRPAIGPQGKSLFPVLVPSLVLLWAGIDAWIPETRRAHAAIALVCVFAILDVAVWGLVALPAYYASL